MTTWPYNALLADVAHESAGPSHLHA